MKKLIALSLLSFSIMAQEPAPVEKTSEPTGLSGFTLYGGLDFRNKIEFDGSANNQAYSANVDLDSPGLLIGAGYEKMIKASESGEWHLGGRVVRNFDQSGDKIVETLGTTNSVTNSKITLKTASIYGTGAYKFNKGDYTYGAGILLGADIVSISGLGSSFSYDISNGTTFGITGSIQRNHIKGEVQIKSTTGDIKARGLGSFSGTNISGEYKYTSMIFLMGYEF